MSLLDDLTFLSQSSRMEHTLKNKNGWMKRRPQCFSSVWKVPNCLIIWFLIIWSQQLVDFAFFLLPTRCKRVSPPCMPSTSQTYHQFLIPILPTCKSPADSSGKVDPMFCFFISSLSLSLSLHSSRNFFQPVVKPVAFGRPIRKGIGTDMWVGVFGCQYNIFLVCVVFDILQGLYCYNVQEWWYLFNLG